MKNILVIASHHDDETLGCGGTIALLSQCVSISVATILDGASGVPHASSPEEAARIRKKEALKAHKKLGVEKSYFLDLPDRGFVYSREALNSFIRLFRMCQPTSIWFPHENDEDIEHKVVHLLAKEAAWMASSAYLPDLGEPSSVIEQILCYEVWSPLTVAQIKVDITSVVEKKRGAISCYKSQLTHTRYDRAILGLNRYRGMAAGVTYMEVFQVLRTPLMIP